MRKELTPGSSMQIQMKPILALVNLIQSRLDVYFGWISEEDSAGLHRCRFAPFLFQSARLGAHLIDW